MDLFWNCFHSNLIVLLIVFFFCFVFPVNDTFSSNRSAGGWRGRNNNTFTCQTKRKICTSCRLKKFKGTDKHLRCISGIFLFRERACFCNPVWCLLLTCCFINKVLYYFIWMCWGFFLISAIHQIVSTLLLSCPPTTKMFQQYLKEETVWLKTNFSSVKSPHALEPESPKKLHTHQHSHRLEMMNRASGLFVLSICPCLHAASAIFARL